MNTRHLAGLALALLAAPGCIQVKTESEIKPIHITMDVNLKVDKELDRQFADEQRAKPQGDFKAIKDLLDRQAAGVTAQAMLEARAGATDDDRILISEANARRLQRFNAIAKDSGVPLASVQKRYALTMRERIPAGSGVWCQNDAGVWLQK